MAHLSLDSIIVMFRIQTVGNFLVQKISCVRSDLMISEEYLYIKLTYSS